MSKNYQERTSLLALCFRSYLGLASCGWLAYSTLFSIYRPFPPHGKVRKWLCFQNLGKIPQHSSHIDQSCYSLFWAKFSRNFYNRSFYPFHLPQSYQTTFGFRARHSIVDQLQCVTSTILSSLEEKFCATAFLDVTQAFDRVRHEGLAVKLFQLIPTNGCQLLASYLENRSFFVIYGEQVSTPHPVSAGVLQGRVLVHCSMRSLQPTNLTNRQPW